MKLISFLLPTNLAIFHAFFSPRKVLYIRNYLFLKFELYRRLSSSVVLGIRTQVLRKPRVILRKPLFHSALNLYVSARKLCLMVLSIVHGLCRRGVLPTAKRLKGIRHWE